MLFGNKKNAMSYEDEYGMRMENPDGGCKACRPVIYLGCFPCLVLFFIKIKCLGPCLASVCSAVARCLECCCHGMVECMAKIFGPCCDAFGRCVMWCWNTFCAPVARCISACCRAIWKVCEALADCVSWLCRPLCQCLAAFCECLSRFGVWFYNMFFAPLVRCVRAIYGFIHEYLLSPIYTYILAPIGRAIRSVGRAIASVFD